MKFRYAWLCRPALALPGRSASLCGPGRAEGRAPWRMLAPWPLATRGRGLAGWPRTAGARWAKCTSLRPGGPAAWPAGPAGPTDAPPRRRPAYGPLRRASRLGIAAVSRRASTRDSSPGQADPGRDVAAAAAGSAYASARSPGSAWHCRHSAGPGEQREENAEDAPGNRIQPSQPSSSRNRKPPLPTTSPIPRQARPLRPFTAQSGQGTDKRRFFRNFVR